jgi:hypothetical protein
MCFNPGDAMQDKLSTYVQSRVAYMRTYYDTSANLKGDCTGAPITNTFCTSFFAKSFPGALNFGMQSMTTIETTTKLNTYAPITAVSQKTYPSNDILYVVVQVGATEVGVDSNTFFIANYKTLFQSIHKLFPLAKILLLSLTPRAFPGGSTPAAIVSLNSALNTTFGVFSNPDFNYVAFGDINYLFFNSKGDVDVNNYESGDGVHFSAQGYANMEYGIKKFVQQYFFSSR